jgi:glycerol kinase
MARDTSKADMINAAFNSITYQTKDIVDCLKNIDIELKSLKIDGGMVANKVFTQQIANLLNTNVLVPDNKESTARGAAVLAGVASQIYDIELVEHQKRTEIKPEVQANEFMLNDYKRWKNLINKALLP